MHKHLLRALGLSLLAALGLMAFAATGAQASGKIKVLGSIPLATGATVGAERDSLFQTLLVPALNIEIVCHNFSVVEGVITNGETGTGKAEVLYEECVVWSTEENAKGELLLVEELPCQLLDSVTGKAGHIRAKAKLLVILHGKAGEENTYVLASPQEVGASFAVIKFTKGTGCPLPTPVNITGSTVFQILEGDLNLHPTEEVVKVLIENSKVLSKLFPSDVLKYGENIAYVDGSAWLFLTGKHLGCKWGAL
jgi:hypothetical protein